MIRDLAGNWQPELNLWASLPFLALGVGVLVVLALDARRSSPARVLVAAGARELEVNARAIRDVTPDVAALVAELTADPATSCADCYFSGRACTEHASR